MAPQEFKAISLKFPPEMLERIDVACKQAGVDRSNWIRNACSAQLSGTSRTADLDSIEVVDPRAREVIRDILRRLETLEASQAASNDPFS